MNKKNHQEIVLVVDDSPDSLGMINTALDQAGYTVLVALNGQQALTITNQLQPSVILLDAMMPIMDGFECCTLLRKQLPLTPIIFMTGLTETEHIVKAFESGGNDYITKPIKPQELIARIKAHSQNANYITNARNALDSARQYIFSVNNEGTILWTTPEAEHLLEQVNTMKDDLSETISEWLLNTPATNVLNISVENEALGIQYFKAVNDNEHLLRLAHDDILFNAETLEAMLPITRRESEVLLWVAHGKSNKEIAEILDMSPRTVNKHLEQLFPKINVDNRTAATSIAIKTLLNISI